MKKKTLLLSGLGLGLLGTGVASADEVQNYTVVAGDTVSEIATKFNTTIDNIDKLNNLKDVDVISVGQVLKVSTLKTNTTTHYSTVEQKPTIPTSQIQTDVNQPNNHDMGYNVKPQATEYPQQTQTKPVQSSGGGSVKDRVIRTAMSQGVSRSTAESMWTNIIMPESGGNPNAVNPAGYEGLYQASSSYGWGRGSVESQTVAGIKYMKERYSSVEGAISYRQGHGSY